MLVFLSRYPQAISWLLTLIFYTDLAFIPATVKASPIHTVSRRKVLYGKDEWKSAFAGNIQWPETGRHVFSTQTPKAAVAVSAAARLSGPGQPEMQGFSSVNNSNMVDLFTGDFSYNIPLLDVGGYPVTLSYKGGISMDQEASWVGLGWSVNPGTINRNMRGLPDDFDGRNDSIRKVLNIKKNTTIGATVGGGLELFGLPAAASASLGLFHNNYKGWGLEYGVNASINSGVGASGKLAGGLSLTNNTQEGVTIMPSFSIISSERSLGEQSSIAGMFSLSLPYNSRSGIKGLQMNAGTRQYVSDGKNQTYGDATINPMISFANPAFTPSISIPYTSQQFSFTAKGGAVVKGVDPYLFVSGYVSSQYIAPEDSSLSLPAYGYLNYQEAQGNRNVLLDFNLEKDLPYHEKPPVPHIALPSYTYDAFSITGEGTGGMFRPYRGDIGFVHDHVMQTKDLSARGSVDFSPGDLVHTGVDLNVNRAYSRSGPWLENNSIQKIIGFKKDSGAFEAAYFRNPGEKAINSEDFYNAIGGDDVVAIKLYQPNTSSSFIQATNYLTRYRNRRAVEDILLKPDNVYKKERDKRTQVISYLTAKEAGVAGLSKYIENYQVNTFGLESCGGDLPVEGEGTGLPGFYFSNRNLEGYFCGMRVDTTIDFEDEELVPPDCAEIEDDPILGRNNYSVRWEGRLRAPETGTYIIQVTSDDGARLWLNDSLLINNWREQPSTTVSDTVNLLAGEFYTLKLEYFEKFGHELIHLKWTTPGAGTPVTIARQYLYSPAIDTFPVGNLLVKEERVNRFRKPNHISEITVLNNDGRRYVYGIPVYNIKQKESTFAVDPASANRVTGLAAYSDIAASTMNPYGIDHYYSSEEIPAYAHSFLLTGVLSADYVDVSGNGISDDDLGDAVKFKYSKVSGIDAPFKWRTPYVEGKAAYNEGLKTDNRDDKGSVVYGEKELWYLHSIESKTMIATFVVESRNDLLSIDQEGHKQNTGAAKRLKEINLYSKAEFARKGVNARPIKSVHFEYTYELCMGINNDISGDSGKLTLKKVWFTYNNNNKGALNPYVFHYTNNQAYQQKAYDRWGNYKNATQNPTNSSADTLYNDEYPYSIQDSAIAADNAGAWTLDSIYLPSGGSIKVDFESDDYAFVQDKRAMQMFKPAGFASAPGLTSGLSSKLYEDGHDNRYIYFSLASSVSGKADFYRKYLQGINKLYFRLFVQMPADIYGSGSEYVSGYAGIDTTDGYGISNSHLGWVKLEGISLKGDGPGEYSPMAKTAIQFLRLNLPSKAYEGSEPGDNLDLATAVKLVASSFQNIATAFLSFDALARKKDMACIVDTNRSYIRLNSPAYKKYGGGQRVKRIKMYDNWNRMTQGKGAVYGHEYTYTTQKEIGGVMTTISSGVASYEPGIGGEENPFRQPIEYVEKASLMAPVNLGYSEEPLGESFFPSPSVGYSKVRVRTINHENARSANGFEETRFYTTYDYPTYTDRSMLDNSTKKRFKPAIANFLRINSRHHLALTQGFKVELNDMNGKLRSKASFAETDPEHPLVYTENVYKTEDNSAEHKRLSNEVSVINADGSTDNTVVIGKDIELMVALREQLSVSTGFNEEVNLDLFNIPFIPFIFAVPSLIPLYQRDENLFRSAATVKVINRYGILDSVIHIDRGSRVATKDAIYDSETGDPVGSYTYNEFNDPVLTFNYSSHWAYDGMGLAYRNIDVVCKHVTIKQGKIISGLAYPDSVFSSGDEIMVAGKLQTGEGDGCDVDFSTFPSFGKIWAIDSSVLNGGTPQLYFIDRNGVPYNGNDVTLKIVRSGRRNILTTVGSATVLGTSSNQVLNANATEFSQFWKVDDRRVRASDTTCAQLPPNDCEGGSSCNCSCLKTLFDYLQSSRRLFTTADQQVTVASLVADAATAGFTLDTGDCPILQNNAYGLFYALTDDSVGTLYRAQLGDCVVNWSASATVDFYALESKSCASGTSVYYADSSYTNGDTLTKTFHDTKTLTRYTIMDDDDNVLPYNPIAYIVDTTTDVIYSARQGLFNDPDFDVVSFVRFDSVNTSNIPPTAQIQSATLYLYAIDESFHGHFHRDAHVVALKDVKFYPYIIATPDSLWDYSSSYAHLGMNSTTPIYEYEISDANQDLTVDATPFVNDWLYGTHGNRGLMFYVNVLGAGTSAHYTTFGSYRYSNSAKRPVLEIHYSVPDSIAHLSVESCRVCDTIYAESCESTVSDTAFNPYTAGVLGNWRANKSYTYYGPRAQSDPDAATNIRTDGAFAEFNPFWDFEDGKLLPQYDSSKWVWNSEITLFNRKGFEIENKDPLGRYNSGLYGYNLTMPTAVVQNSRYREAGFDGFEDYDFTTQVCDTVCAANRQMDFSTYRDKLDTVIRHSGKSSLRLEGGVSDQAGLSFPLSTAAEDSMQTTIAFNLGSACSTSVLEDIKTSDKILLPSFSPLKGSRMVLSAWVREDQDCKCTSYVNNSIVVSFDGGETAVTFHPSGNIIEGWQRYESVFDIPDTATMITVSLRATGSVDVNFDDIRIHPYNANMKSFVYHPVNLRLMAELDENNYATFYEYDDDGTLIRLKKETERGIKTIRETRSALLKE